MSSPYSFPSTLQVVVTTCRGVYYWGHHGVRKVFKSESKGIVAAKRTSNEKELLAVADSQVVILHDIDKGIQRTYKLKRGDQVGLDY